MKTLLIIAVLMALVTSSCKEAQSDPVLVTAPFSYTATGDDGIVGQATTTQIRMALSAAELQNSWENCTIISEHVPWAPGVKDTINVSFDVETGVDYYFAAKIADEVPHWSLISNIFMRQWADETAPSPIGDFDIAD